MPPASLPLVVADWQRLERQGLTRSPAYLHHRGHPLLSVWGLGFPGRGLKPQQAATLLAGLQQASKPYGGVTLLGGVPSYWRTGMHDASADPAWQTVWPMLGVISPWSVGRYDDAQSADTYLKNVTIPDMALTRQMGIDYMPVIFPGYAHRNAILAHDPGRTALHITPRQCGNFYWRQVSKNLGAGATMLYNAMFDEVNEGTAMFKTIADPADEPVRGVSAYASFVALDESGCKLPSDWYLRLAGAATQAVRTGAHPSAKLPF
jgi:hypothetical protein